MIEIKYVKPLILALTFSFSGPLSAATFSLDFVGIATSTSGKFASETVPSNTVTGSILIDSDLPFTTSSLPVHPTEPTNIDRILQAVTNGGLSGSLSAEVHFGSLSERLDTPDDGRGRGNATGQIDIRAIDSANGPNDYVIVTLTGGVGLPRFDFQLYGEELIGDDPSLGFSQSLLDSIDLGAVFPGFENFGALTTFDDTTNSIDGAISFSVSSISVREVNSTSPVSPVPLPAGLLLLLSGFGGMLLLHRRRQTDK